MTASVLYQASEGVATLTLNRPDVLNAMNGDLMRELREGVERAAGDAAVRAVLITGAGRGFCAGADLAARGKMASPIPARCCASASPPDHHDAAPDAQAGRHRGQRCGRRCRHEPGAGGRRGAGGALGQLPAGILQDRSDPGRGSTYFVPRYAGEMRARALAILAEKIDAEEAQRIGLVWKVHADDALQDEAGKLARHLATMPTMAYGMIKEALNQSFDNDLAAQLEVEATLQSRASRSDDCKEGVAAFMEKRKPQFKGR